MRAQVEPAGTVPLLRKRPWISVREPFCHSNASAPAKGMGRSWKQDLTCKHAPSVRVDHPRQNGHGKKGEPPLSVVGTGMHANIAQRRRLLTLKAPKIVGTACTGIHPRDSLAPTCRRKLAERGN